MCRKQVSMPVPALVALAMLSVVSVWTLYTHVYSVRHHVPTAIVLMERQARELAHQIAQHHQQQERAAARDNRTARVDCARYTPVLLRAVLDVNRFRIHHGGITRSLLEQLTALPEGWEGFMVHIRSHRAYVSRVRPGTESRVAAMLLLTYIALTPEVLATMPDTHYFISTSDEGPRERPHLPIMSFNRPVAHDPSAIASLLVPDFTFFAWPESLIGPYDTALASLHEVAARTPFAERTDRLFWRGAASPSRQALGELAAREPDTTDIKYIGWGGWKDGKRLMPDNYVKLADQCNWKYLYHSDGMWGMYSSRFKFLLACGSLVLSPWPNVKMEEYWYPLLQPDVNYAAVPAVGELGATYARIRREWDAAKQQRVAAAGAALAQMLDRQGALCYYQRLVREYADATRATGKQVPPLPPRSELLENALTTLLNAGLSHWQTQQ